ncbi:hypothetical protein DB43_BH00010 [Parachlamydia acanthamoebae]|uniref:Uncharacterized protein n=1 Tax=Parachlamydia acanthamoebae TaxID=83552 RepID=A0A0C1C4M1_9BACT|nr:hypothetical protein DB43_BH00010 [Parachlamydia acanthamoebae]
MALRRLIIAWSVRVPPVFGLTEGFGSPRAQYPCIPCLDFKIYCFSFRNCLLYYYINYFFNKDRNNNSADTPYFF